MYWFCSIRSHDVREFSDRLLGAESPSSPVRFQIPNRPGATVQVTGRAVSAAGTDSGHELALVTRWLIGGAAGVLLDEDVPPPPAFGLQPAGQGTVELAAIGFATLGNTRTISAGTLRLFYWNELLSPAQVTLTAAVSAAATSIAVSASVQTGELIQIGAEVFEVVSVAGLNAQVLRGSHGTAASAHSAGAAVYTLDSKTFVLAFSRDFFGSPASGAFAYPVFLPDVRIAAAELYVTNSRGNSETAKTNFTATADLGIRTLSGGQLTIQVEGYLAIETGAAPPLVIEDAHAVRDVFAVVREASTGAPVDLALLVNGNPYCTLTIGSGATVSNTVSGFGLAALQPLDRVTLNIVSVGSTAATAPGRDLTVTIRL